MVQKEKKLSADFDGENEPTFFFGRS